MRKLLISLLLCCFFCAFLMAQHLAANISIDQFIADVFEQYNEESGAELDFDGFYEELAFLSQHPIDLNSAEREDIEKMMFLSDIQIENILYYRYKAGEFLSIYELLLVEGLDMTDIRRMLPFVTISKSKATQEKINLKKAFKFGKHEIQTRFDLVPEQKKGYIKDGAHNSAYRGNKLYHQLKYRFDYKDRLFVNFTTEKDAGEQFWGKMHKGCDFISVSVQAKDIGLIKNLILGDYQVGFGQGLVIWQAFNTGKSSMPTKVCNLSSGFKRYGSTNEYNYQRGLALTLQHRKLNLHMFCSRKYVDGSVQENVFSGFYQTGYHRTSTEIEKRRTVRQQVAGGNAIYKGMWFQIGLSSLVMRLDKELIPETHPYSLFYFQGDRQWVTGINYRFRLNKFNFFGETAFTDMKHPAIITGMTCSPLSRVNLALLYRYYAPEYNSFFASPFSEGSGTGNEQGVYLGAEVLPAKKWKIAFYADSYRFPWLRYGIDFPSFGTDLFLQLNYTPVRKLSLFIRAKHKQYGANKSGSSQVIPEISLNQKTSLRFQSVYETGNLKFKQQVDANVVSGGLETSTFGLAALQEVSVNFSKIPLKLDFSYLFFDAENYDNRIYIYEKDILYAFSIPAFSGAGSRYYVNLRYDVTSALSCWLKFSQLLYTDGRETIGSGYEMIQENRKTEIKLQVRFKF
ncbi:MAG: helix-hairpin-helix domain-containing protein [Paludibacter sp.]|nr:helix-hairpin-helix domain-containing protein [Paludibacter sp.]